MDDAFGFGQLPVEQYEDWWNLGKEMPIFGMDQT